MTSSTFPAHDPSTADLLREINAMKRDIKALQAKPQKDDVPGFVRQEIVFSYPGLLSGDISGSYLIRDFAGTIHHCLISFEAAPEDTIALTVLVNGDTVASIPCDADIEIVDVPDLAVEVEAWDRVQVQFIEIASGATAVGTAATCVVHLQLATAVGDEYQ